MDTFVIPHSVTTVSAAESNSGGTSDSGSGGSSLAGKKTDATSTGEAASGTESRTSVSSEESTDNNGQNTEAVQTETSGGVFLLLAVVAEVRARCIQAKMCILKANQQGD